jgi:hypothetical protein
MPIPFLDNPEYWLTRAKEARVVAEQLNDIHSKNVMRSIARDYERMAELREATNGGPLFEFRPGHERGSLAR